MAERQKNQLTNEELQKGWNFVADSLGFANYVELFAYEGNKDSLEAQIIKYADPDDERTKGWTIDKDPDIIPRIVEKDKKGRPVYIEAVCNGDAEKAEKRKETEAKKAAKTKAQKQKAAHSEGNPKDTKISEEEQNKDRGGNAEEKMPTFMTDTDAAHPAPNPKIAVFVPDDSWNYPDAPTHIFEAADGAEATARALQEYSWTDTTDGAGRFSFSVVNEVFGKGASDALKGKTLFDAIKIRSVVKIYETNDTGDGGDKPNFVGIIRDKSVSASMGSNGVRRQFAFSGDDIMSSVFEFELFPMNVNIADESLAVDLTAIFSGKKGWSMVEACEKTWRFFLDVANGGAKGTTALETMLAKFAGDNFFKPVGKNLKMSYSPIMPLSPTGSNPYGEILRKLFPPPYYSVFSQTRDGKPGIWFFSAVFLKDNYNAPNMKPLKIGPLRITNYNLTQTDRNVSTVFMATVNGMMMTDAQAKIASDGIAYDNDARRVYGQKLCQAAVWGGSPTSECYEATQEMLKELAEGMKEMYSGEDRFYNGTITVLAETRKGGAAENPSACSRISCLGGDFFVRSATHSWRFGGPHLISLSVEKGCASADGGFNSAKPLEKLGTIATEAGE